MDLTRLMADWTEERGSVRVIESVLVLLERIKMILACVQTRNSI